MAEAYLTDNTGLRREDIPYPFDWDTISEYGIKPQLTITLSPEETRELMVAAEQSIRHKYSVGGSAHAMLSFDYSHYFFKNWNSTYYNTQLSAFVFNIKPDQGISSEDYYETLPNEWVVWTYTQSRTPGYHYWYRASGYAT